MNEEEAKLILQCRRPRGQDDQEDAIREALGMISADSAAMELLRQEEQLDALIGERLRSIEPPLDLRRKILLGAKVAPRASQWWSRRRWIAAAAGLAVGIPVFLKYIPASRPGDQVLVASALTDFRSFTTKKLTDGPKLEKFETIDEVKTHFASCCRSKSQPMPAQLCECTEGTVGCEVFDWKGNEVTLVCFKAGKKGIVHLFSVDAAALDTRPEKSVCVPLNGWQTLVWVERGKLMLLAGDAKEATEEDLRALVE
jgi:hypothetical protein